MPDRNINPLRVKFLSEFVVHVKLVFRLMKDKRINPFLKILPFGGLIYLIIPDLLVGPIDDAALLLGGSYLFLELCPQKIIDEHLQQLRLDSSKDQTDDRKDENIIDAEFRDVDK
ncbi:MAG: hypothetical protein HGB14_12725 [Anaerolineaceae bacterium]|nr:hypothetical protein [Anaerolineaceae bacterium]